MEVVDIAFEAAKLITSDATSDIDGISSEEETKLKIITKILCNVLGWPTSRFRCEFRHENGYSDYLISDNGYNELVVEAKRLGLLELQISNKNECRHLKISGPALSKVSAGIDQAARYAMPYGIPVAVLTDGLTWIVFKTFVAGEHYKDKTAIVFPSFEAILNDFTVFYELLSRASFAKREYNKLFDAIHNQRDRLLLPLHAPYDVNSIRLMPKDAISFDLDKLFDGFFSKLQGEEDPDVLIECFVETRESRFADFSLEKITMNIIQNISGANREIGTALETLIKDAVDIDEGQNVFIVGPTGSGKTTFLERFFKKTLSSNLRNRCISLRVNCLDASGREDMALSWLTESLIEMIENELYPEGAPSWDELRGLYHLEYLKRSRGVDAHLYNFHKDKFRIKFGEFMDAQVNSDREGYLKRLIKDIVNNRKKLPIIIIDNMDEFSLNFKQAIFQFGQSLRRYARHCMLIFPVTDKSAWIFSKTDIFNIYQSKSFFLPTPPPREVFRKRITYLRSKIDIDHEERRRTYLSQRGILISTDKLSEIARILEDIFVNQENTSKTLGELANFNIRKTLDLSRRIVTSSTFKIEDILKTYTTVRSRGGSWFSYTRFLNALMKGDYELYRRNDQHQIFPIFQVDSKINQSPLLFLRILFLLESAAHSGRDINEKHMYLKSIYDYLEACDCSEVAIDSAIAALMHASLIEPYDMSVREISPGQQVAISFSGRRHIELATHNPVFFTQMALTTYVTDEDVARTIRTIYTSSGPFRERAKQINTQFADFLISEDRKYIKIPEKLPQYSYQRELDVRIRNFGSHSTARQKIDSSVDIETERRPSQVSGVIARVDWFDEKRGFGFADAEEIDGQIYVHSRVVEEAGFLNVGDGDDILCDVSFTDRGPTAVTIHELQRDAARFSQYEGKVVRIFEERRYGFVEIPGMNADVFFHFSVLSEDQMQKLAVGSEVSVEVRDDQREAGRQVRKFIAIK